ncbi:MAG: 30S ribosomal protein S4 [Methanotrichaceae archaeon]
MGYPGKSHKAYDTPQHLWEADRIEQEVKLIKDFGLRNKKELWRAQSMLRKYRRASRILLATNARGEESVEFKIDEILNRLKRYGALNEDGNLDSILSMKLENLLERRLQTQVYRQGLAKTLRQARQFITHGHIQVSGQKVTVPGYYVKRGEEMTIDYYLGSPMAQENHPERTARVPKVEG